MAVPFRFYSQAHLVKVLGRKANNVETLVEGIKNVPGSSIYYHTHRFLQQHHYLSPEPPNDFAYWIGSILNQARLAEAIASVDTVSFVRIEDLRQAFIKILTASLKHERNSMECPEGQDFYFRSCQTFVFPTGHVANDLREFLNQIKMVTVHSLYFHMFEAPLRLKKEESDFVAWFKGIGELDLAKKIARLDPYTMTLEGLRKRIIKLVGDYVTAKH
ncbi:MAG: DUF5752 family protein [Kiritimatiellae bacterium]|nr:DUF5752 family protein [Kiritimatiellia bacterium]MDD5519210.1 DUF5752 family protein [Kiritimatiellia bacterium]